MTAARFAEVPAQMRAERRWLCWTREPDPKHPDKPRKVPAQARRIGLRASSTDPATWSSYADAVAALRNESTYAGLGFALGDGWAGVDLDHCVDPTTGEVDEWAQAIVAELASYAEVSPSGTGVHIILRGALPPGRRKNKHAELYDGGRFFTVTGQALGTRRAIEERTATLAQLHARLFPPETPKDVLIWTSSPTFSLAASDAELIDLACRARNGARFALLYAGDWKGAGYDSHSEADLALCSHLLYWTEGDADRADQLFRASGLMRDKWDEQRGAQTYRERTLSKASQGETVVRHRPRSRLGGTAWTDIADRARLEASRR